jgi:hypothetical protein
VVGIGGVGEAPSGEEPPAESSVASSANESGGGERPRPEAAAPAATVPADSPALSLRGRVLDLLLIELLILTGADEGPFGVGITKLPAGGAVGPEYEDESPDDNSFDRVRPIFLDGVWPIVGEICSTADCSKSLA